MRPDKGETFASRESGSRSHRPRTPCASASRRSISTPRWCRPCPSPATSSSAASHCDGRLAASASSIMSRMRRRSDQGDRRRRSASALARRVARRIVGRPAPGRRDRARDAFQVAKCSSSTSRPIISPSRRRPRCSASCAACRRKGVTGILISHNLHHVFQSCDRVVAMARGEIVFDKPVAETSVEEVSDVL